jgi:N-formylglutamate amidohydrolase
MNDLPYPPWAVLHIPHDSTVVPAQVRTQFLLTDSALTFELQRMTDHFTHLLFAERPDDAAVAPAPVSRLVVDIERFADDSAEPMAARCMGAVYKVTSDLKPLRRQLSPAERDSLLPFGITRITKSWRQLFHLQRGRVWHGNVRAVNTRGFGINTRLGDKPAHVCFVRKA